MTKSDLEKYALDFFNEERNILTSGDMQTIVKFIQSIPINIDEKITPKIELVNEKIKLTDKQLPFFLNTYEFDDEYEANLMNALWLQYSKNIERNSYGRLKIDYYPFQWIYKAVFRIIGVKSKFQD